MNKKQVLFLLIVGYNSLLFAQDWSSNIAGILYENCTSCHRPGGLGPASFMTYPDAVAHANLIQSNVVDKIMPPWMPNPDYCHFKDEKILSPTEIQAIKDWVNNGTPAGNLALAPNPPVYTSNSMLSTIHDSYTMEPYTLTTHADEHRMFAFSTHYTQEKYLSEIEFLPGSYSAVHHIVLYQDTAQTAYNADLADPLSGFGSNGTFQIGESAKLITGWLPGSGPLRLPLNIGFKVLPNAYYIMEIHYAPGNIGVTDSTKINLRFSSSPSPREAKFETFYPTMLNPPFVIPADSIKTFYQEKQNIPSDISLISIYPHAHLICQDFKVFALNPTQDTTPLIQIPDWDFHWQNSYNFQKMIHLPAGTTIREEATYNNTASNPDNPFSPPQTINNGQFTTDEMMVCLFAYVDYLPGDENIILDSTLIQTAISPIKGSFFSVYPIPTSDKLSIHATWEEGKIANISIFDLKGSLLYQNKVYIEQTFEIPTQHFPKGEYLLEIQTDTQKESIKWIKW